ncbi:hypothetical protein EVAR_8760_1 [Eumeta japonica]|uniref:Uncharacterized protein n=1 Tax=Eumeta variegata TaxID=151549 RepID=A0A4C1TTT4_EUMVA|nr:hypothetical protein EVAR_8760_1 [Eumeta japonica]
MSVKQERYAKNESGQSVITTYLLLVLSASGVENHRVQGSIDYHLARNRVPNEVKWADSGEDVPMDTKMVVVAGWKGMGHLNSHLVYERQDQKLLLHVCALRGYGILPDEAGSFLCCSRVNYSMAPSPTQAAPRRMLARTVTANISYAKMKAFSRKDPP